MALSTRSSRRRPPSARLLLTDRPPNWQPVAADRVGDIGHLGAIRGGSHCPTTTRCRKLESNIGCWRDARAAKSDGLESFCAVHHLSAAESAGNTFRRTKMLTAHRVSARWALRILTGRERTYGDKSGLQGGYHLASKATRPRGPKAGRCPRGRTQRTRALSVTSLIHAMGGPSGSEPSTRAPWPRRPRSFSA